MEMERKLEEFQRCFDKSPIAFAILKALCNTQGKLLDFIICYINETLAKLDGRSVLEMQGQPLSHVLKQAESPWNAFCTDTALCGTEHQWVAHRVSAHQYFSVRTYCPQEGYCACILADVTAEKETEIALRQANERFHMALEHSDIDIWEYDLVHDRCIQPCKMTRHFDLPNIVENYPASLFGTGAIHPDSESEYVRLSQMLKQGAVQATMDVQLRNAQGGYEWHRIDYQTLFSDDGKPIKAIGVSRELTSLKAMEERYAQELSYLQCMVPNTVSSCNIDLTNNTVSQKNSRLQKNNELRQMVSADGLFARVATHIIGEEDRKRFIAQINREAMLRCFYEGRTEFSMDYRYDIGENSHLWLLTRVHMMKHPHTENIEAFVYTTDITEEKTAKEMIDKVIALDYDHISWLDGKNNNYITFASSDSTSLPMRTSNDYDGDKAKFLTAFAVESDREKVVEAVQLRNVFRQLETQSEYTIEFSLREANGEIRKKRLRYCYINREARFILLTRTDITDIVTQEVRQREDLRNALLAAEQANQTKTDFLSRMSHEIRTPMNAIIGMSALAAQCVSDPAQVADCLSKIGISARFLLSLINDILDMSRIESGKVYIKQENIPFAEFISNINVICFAQAQQKGVQYDTILTSYTEDVYIGDAMKLQQVLINILSNAIKFTAKGGKVQFIIHQDKISNGQATLRFTVNDTGVGIREDFLPHLFDPFAQGWNGTTSTYGGTGLGLAICKNLVALMGGTIHVNSIEGVGTEFHVIIKLGVSEEVHKKSQWKMDIGLSEMKALIVDDDLLVCRHTEQILSDMGMKVDYVTSGAEAVERVSVQWAKGIYYHIIFVDWQMPEMDGIETTRRAL
ncbi:MAG: ATP-binding protein, partial [Clostridia bacterium]